MLAEAQDLSLRDRILALRSLDSLAPLEEQSLALIAEHSRFRSFREGEVLLQEGQPPANLYIVLEGQVKVEQHGKLVTHVGRSFGVGFVSTLSRDDHGVTATAQEETATIEIPIDAFWYSYEQDFALARNSLRLAAVSVLKLRGQLPAPVGRKAEAGTLPERALTMVERVIQFRRGPVFSRCHLDAVIDLVRRSCQVHYEAGATIWSAGDPTSFSVGVDYGVIRCMAPDGSETEVGPGFFIGVMDGFAMLPRAYTATAVTPVVGFRINVAVFMGVLESHLELAKDLQAVLSRELLAGN